jgi:cell division protein FtsW
VVTGCLPTKGLPFPFLSYGGSGLVVTLTAIGLLAGLARGEQT